jgi:phosphocarrier protein
VLTREAEICNELGLHARAAARLVDLANRYASSIHLSHGSRRVNGKSIMGVLMLAAGKGSVIQLEVAGPDQADALHAVAGLIEDGFGEN